MIGSHLSSPDLFMACGLTRQEEWPALVWFTEVEPSCCRFQNYPFCVNGWTISKCREKLICSQKSTCSFPLYVNARPKPKQWLEEFKVWRSASHILNKHFYHVTKEPNWGNVITPELIPFTNWRLRLWEAAELWEQADLSSSCWLFFFNTCRSQCPELLLLHQTYPDGTVVTR